MLSVCAMLSKEQGITALALCLIYDIFIFNKVKHHCCVFQLYDNKNLVIPG